uniref:Uncharacterized protein n=1 Tax=Anguilla anguilla TaxID=7936 RepID=A0A0E9W659_ANGAN
MARGSMKICKLQSFSSVKQKCFSSPARNVYLSSFYLHLIDEIICRVLTG